MTLLRYTVLLVVGVSDRPVTQRQSLIALLNSTTQYSPEVVAAEARVVSRVLAGYPTRAKPESLAQNVMLLLGGSAHAAGAATGEGLAAADVFLGWFNSHKDRRRALDMVPPCESKTPPDTNDPDCFARRWKMINEYYPMHNGLVRGDRILVKTEAEAEGVSNRIYGLAKDNENAIFGHGGPSGLIYETKRVLEPATTHLKDWTDKAFTALDQAQTDMEVNSRSDVQRERDDIRLAIDNLFTDAGIRFELQDASAALNLNNVLQAATTGLSNVVQTMMSHQHKLVRQRQEPVKAVLSFGAQTEGKIRFFEKKMDKLDSVLVSLENTVDSEKDKAQSEMSRKLQTMMTDLESTTKDAMNIRHVVWDKTQEVIEQRMMGAGKTAHAELSPVVHRQLESNSKAAFELDKWLKQTSKSGISMPISDAADVVVDALSDQIAVMGNNARTQQQLQAQVSKVSAKLSALADVETKEMAENAKSFESYIEAEKENVLGRIYNILVNTVRNHGSAFKPAVTAIIDAVFDARERISSNEIEYGDKTSKTAFDLGKQNFAIATSNKDLFSLLSSASAEMRQNVLSQMDDVNEWSRRNTSQLLGLLGDALTVYRKEQSSGNPLVGLDQNISTGHSLASEGITETRKGVKSEVLSLLKTILQTAKDSGKEGEDSSAALARLTTLASGSSSFSRALTEALKSTSVSQSNNLAYLALALASADDKVAGSFGSSGSKALTWQEKELAATFVSKFHVEKLDLLRALSQAISDRMRATRMNQTSFNSSSAILTGNTVLVEDETARIREALVKMMASVDESYSGIDRKLADRKEVMENRLITFVNSQNSTVANFQLDAASFADFLRIVMNNKRDGLEGEIGGSASELSALKSRLEAMAQLNISTSRVLGERFGALGGMTSDLRGSTYGLLDSIESNVTSFGERIDSLEKRMMGAKRNVSNHILHVSNQVQSEVLNFPVVIASMMTGPASDPNIEQTEIAVKDTINQLREKLAVTTVQEERDRIIAQLAFLTNLERLAGNLVGESHEWMQRVDGLKSRGNESISVIGEGMAKLIWAIKQFEFGKDVDEEALLRSVAVASATLINGLRKFSESTDEGLHRNATETISSEKFEFGISSNGGKIGLNQSIRRVNDTDMILSRLAAELLLRMDQFHQQVQRLNNTKDLTYNSIGERIKQVLTSVNMGTGILEGSSAANDVLGNLGAIRYSANRFSGLLYELGEATTDSMVRQTDMASEDRERIQIEAVDTLTKLINQLQQMGAGKIVALKTAVEKEWDHLDTFEDSFDSAIDDLVDDLDFVNERRYNKSLIAEKEIARVSDFSDNSSSVVVNAVDKQLDKFDNEYT